MSFSFDSLGEDDTLTGSLFHKILVASNLPSSWPTWLVILSLIGLSIIAGVFWWTLSGDWRQSLAITAVHLVCHSSDAILLSRLPRLRISFGPWKGQLLALTFPRLAATAVLGLLGNLLGWQTVFTLAILIQALGILALYRGAVVEPRQLSLSRLLIHLDPPLQGPPLRILHISDLHIERLGEREDRLLKFIEEADADLIAITGDYVNLSNNLDPVTHGQVRAMLNRLAAPYGVFAVLGSPPVDLPGVIPPLFEGLPIRMLRDEAVKVTFDEGRYLTVIGMDCHHDLERDGDTLARLVKQAPAHGPRLLLYHSPELMPQAAAHGIHLYLCGHTHGGQVRLPLIGALLTSSKLGRRYVMGHYHEGQTHLYISRGVGFEGLGAPRVRLFCPPEITMVTLAANSG